MSIICRHLSISANLLKILRSEDLFRNIGDLTSTLMYKLDPGHCYTIITDALYQSILEPQFFREIKHSSYFVIQVAFHENMSSPEANIMEPLDEARKTGCQTYLIYLANGIQMDGLLRFIDE